MKKLIISELLLLFLATTFMTDSLPPGWYQQTLPVNKLINDIFFLDSLTGWAVTAGASSSSDTGYVMKTTNAGSNWIIQLDSVFNYKAVQFLDLNNGYAAGGTGRAKFLKTTNGGAIWIVSTPFGSNMYSILDISFVSRDTGWICSDDPFGGGIYKTINGGINWAPQLAASFHIQKLFFINKDTGWAGSSDSKLYRSTNGGAIWNLAYTFTPASNVIRGFYFLNGDTGWSINYSGSGTNGIYKTTNSGFNWVTQIDPDSLGSGLSGIYMASLNVGYITTGFSKIIKTVNGQDWFRQNAPEGTYSPIYGVDSNRVWAGGAWMGSYFVINTIDGGGPPVGIVKSNIAVKGFILKQNYPNPFNPVTLIFFDLPKDSRVDLKLYNILGEEVSELLDDEFFTAGSVQFGFNADEEDLSSGVYFYRLTARAEGEQEIFIDTKKMVLLK